jgi:cell division protein FtsI/penicillin-binding protein 2
MLDPISRALLSRIFVLLLLSLALYRLPAILRITNPSSSQSESLASKAREGPGRATTIRFTTDSFLPQTLLDNDPSFLTKNGVPVIRIVDNTPSLLPNFIPQFAAQENGHFVTHLDGGYTVVWTIDPELQSKIGRYIRQHLVPYGFFIAENPKTGRLLAFWGSRRSQYDGSLLLRATYPAASLFKIITATDALSQRKITPNTRIHFHGCLYCIGPAYWHNDRRRDRIEFTVAEALGKSINTVFAKIALKYLSPNDLRETAVRYGFNRPLRSDLPIDPSHADIPDDLNGFAFASAGFGDVAISPIHAAAIAGALSNEGVMMKPHLIEKIIGEGGKILYQDSPEYLYSVTSPPISQTMIKMMRSTVVKGTGHRAFFRWRFNPKLRHILVAGKTGTLTGKNPAGHYVWFIGTASNQDPTIAVAALTIDQGIWTIKGPDIASKGMYTFFNEKHSDKIHG